MKDVRRVLFASDFSPASTYAFERAVEAAKSSRAELLIAHVISPVIPVATDGYVSPKVYDDLVAASRADAQKRLAALVAKAKKAGARATALLLEGSAWDQITRAARAKKADLIVMGTHGRSGFKKLLLGSVAERVVGNAPCPVLTVRGKGGK